MNDEHEQTTALTVPTGIGDDQLLAVAAAAEKRVEAVNKIKLLALRVTNSQDWMDQGGKPYLQVSGAEKVARLFGISWRLDEPTREDHDDGHFSYTFKGYFSMGTAEVEVIGTRSSQDPFFAGSRDRPKPPSEIDRNDVKKGAMTNCLGNGISRLLGIRNMTWDEVNQGGVTRSAVGKVHYKDADPNAVALLPNYGKHKGKPVNDASVTEDDLRGYLAGAEKSIADPSKAKWKAKEEAMRDAIKAELARRASTQASEPSTDTGVIFPDWLAHMRDDPDRAAVLKQTMKKLGFPSLELDEPTQRTFIHACQSAMDAANIQYERAL